MAMIQLMNDDTKISVKTQKEAQRVVYEFERWLREKVGYIPVRCDEPVSHDVQAHTIENSVVDTKEFCRCM